MVTSFATLQNSEIMLEQISGACCEHVGCRLIFPPHLCCVCKLPRDGWLDRAREGDEKAGLWAEGNERVDSHQLCLSWHFLGLVIIICSSKRCFERCQRQLIISSCIRHILIFPAHQSTMAVVCGQCVPASKGCPIPCCWGQQGAGEERDYGKG